AAAGGGLKISVGIFPKIGSDFVQKAPQLKNRQCRFFNCGEGGIRTHGTFRYTVFPGPPIKPLLHLSILYIY
ncbi:MAG: hypothetical protein COZ88_02030, partial [Candidatus Nealsonbacteria bacterium CG_4_8_14_3_um_filter_34_13]